MLKDLIEIIAKSLVDNPDSVSVSEIEGELRKHGAEMVFLALNLVEKERKEVEEISKLSRRLPG